MNVKKVILPILAVLVVFAAALSLLLPKLRSQPVSDTALSSSVTFNASDITSTASFFDYDADGTTVELFAVQASDNTLRLALNTCQVCNGSPYAYFVQEGDDFVCQNCGNHFSSNQIGIAAGFGCNPIPVTESDYAEEDGVITVSTAFLEENAKRFTNWKQF